MVAFPSILATGVFRMRLAPSLVGLTLVSGLCSGLDARAGSIVFDTESTATQNISSPLLGNFTLTATGPQQFTIDTTNGTANVTSMFQGSDFPDPITGHDTYNLYNTVTTGTVTTNPSGSFNISFQLLFELDVTSGTFAGLSLVTTQDAIFAASNVPTLPFPVGTAFSDPSGSDSVNVFLKNAFGGFPAGAPAGTSSDRLVTVNAIIPEPSSIVSASLAALIGVGIGWRRRRASLSGRNSGNEA
jgi:hypothetical protein